MTSDNISSFLGFPIHPANRSTAAATMLRNMNTALFLLATAATALSFCMPRHALAASAISSTQVSGGLSAGYMESDWNVWNIYLLNPFVQAVYTATIETDSGQNACSSTVPPGTPVTVSFKPDQITWNGTGGSMDTPNGYWIPNAGIGFPLCSSGDQIGGETTIAWGSIQYYTPFSAAPPIKTIGGTALSSTLSCPTTTPDASGKIHCTTGSAGSGTLQVNYAPTYGKFYFHTLASQNTSSTCGGALGSPAFGFGLISPSEPMRLAVSTTRGNPVNGCGPSCGTNYYGDAGYVIDDGGTYGAPSSGISVWSAGDYVPQPYKVQIPAGTIACPITVAPAGTQTVPPPTISTALGQCIVGSTFALRISGSSPTAKDIRYGIDWANTGVVTQYAPASGFVSSGTQQTASRTFSSTGPKTIRVRTEEENGSVSNWATMTFACNDPATPNEYPGDDSGSGTGGGSGTRSPAISIRAVPSLVRGGSTTRVIWTAENVTSCSVSGTNGDHWNALQSSTSGEVSGTIKARTIFTLNCTSPTGSISADTAVNIIPTFEER